MGSIDHLHRALAACPLLEDLVCIYTTLSTPDSLDTPGAYVSINRVDLPRLQSASLHFWSHLDFQYFLSPIHFPPFLRLKLELPGDAEYDLRNAYPTTMDMMLRLPSFFLIRQLGIYSYSTYHGMTTYAVHAGSQSDLDGDISQIKQPHLLEIRCKVASGAPRLYKSIAKSLPLQTLELLVVGGFCGPSRDFVDLLAKASSLTTLTLWFLPYADYLIYLAATPSFYLCPRLRVLRFKNTDISAYQLIQVAVSRTKFVVRVGHYTRDIARFCVLELKGCKNIKDKMEVDQALRTPSLEVRWK
ncbi:hypothetical protein BOTBODRAFT_504108 [Botryobasidium botryosum FD-172 SS1]|uniref:F-box domain-containing protein n=1 Tax=Botryobasidium botryosum (strain FD-172 SS1) TaxID=930990 RepID=A0A067M2M1_BOTB1|nr:hypothetical protein BOTBODRAFT_504108 [Botryobasidium botryosum FD-172 SS1]